MIYIAHRGNLNGPNKDENKPEYIKKSISLGFDCEIDIRYINNILYLGHDTPDYKIDLQFLIENKNKLWIHCKDIDSLIYLKDFDLNCFYHNLDDYTITTKGDIWGNIGSKTNKTIINVMPEKSENKKLYISKGICSDYIMNFKEMYQQINQTNNERKIAIFFSGRINRTQQTIETLLFMKKKFKIEFFCSINDSRVDYDFINLFDIKKSNYNFEKHVFPENLKIKNKRPETNINNTMSMFYNWMKNFQLIENFQKKQNMLFDIIINYRSDILSSEFINFDKIENINFNTIYIPQGNDWGGVNDQMAFGNFDSMKKYCEIYKNIQKYNDNDNVIFHPETLLKHHLKCSNVNIIRFYFKYVLVK